MKMIIVVIDSIDAAAAAVDDMKLEQCAG